MTTKLSFVGMMATASWSDIKKEVAKNDAINNKFFDFIAKYIFGKKDAKERVAGTNTKEETNKVFQKMYKVISYTNFVENAYLAKQIEENKDNIYSTQEVVNEDWTVEYKEDEKITYSNKTELEALVSKMTANPEDYQIWDKSFEEIRDDFRQKKLSDLSWLSISNDDIKTYNPRMTTKVEEINNERTKQQKQIEEWKSNEVLTELENSCEDELSWWIVNTMMKKRPPLTLLKMFKVTEPADVKKKIMEQAWFKEMIEKHKKHFWELKKNWSKKEIKKAIDDYQTLRKDIATTVMWTAEWIDENWNVLLNFFSTLWYTIWNTKERFTYWVSLFWNGLKDWDMSDMFWWVIATSSAAWPALIVWWLWAWIWLKMVWFWKTWNYVIKKTTKLWAKATVLPFTLVHWAMTKLKWRALWKRILSWLPATILREIFYKDWKWLKSGFRKWLSFKKSYNVWKIWKWKNNIDTWKFLSEMWIENWDMKYAFQRMFFDWDELSKDANKIRLKKMRKRSIEFKRFKKNNIWFKQSFIDDITNMDNVVKDWPKWKLDIYRKLLLETNTKKYSDLVVVLQDDNVVKYLWSLDEKWLSKATKEIWKKLKNWESITVDVLKNLNVENLTEWQKKLVKDLDDNIKSVNDEITKTEKEIEKITSDIEENTKKINARSTSKKVRKWLTTKNSTLKKQKLAKENFVKGHWPKQIENIENVKQLVKESEPDWVKALEKLLWKVEWFKPKAKLLSALWEEWSDLRKAIKKWITWLDDVIENWWKPFRTVLKNIDTSVLQVFEKNADELISWLKAIWRFILKIL